MEDDDKKKIEEDIVFDFKNSMESLYYSEDIVEQDVTENFGQWLLKRSYQLRILFLL